MTRLTLCDRVILVAEDEYLLAQDLCAELTASRAVVLGPAATIAQGLSLLQTAQRVDGAILDINLRGEPVFVLADELMSRNVSFVFTTGYGSSAIPPRFAHVRKCEKPVRGKQVIQALLEVGSA